MQRGIIPIATQGAGAHSCDDAAPFALMVLGDSMAPEFIEGDVIVVEPDGHLAVNAYVVAQHEGEWLLRQLTGDEGKWRLHALAGSAQDVALDDLSCIRGVVIQKRPAGGRRRDTCFYT